MEFKTLIAVSIIMHAYTQGLLHLAGQSLLYCVVIGGDISSSHIIIVLWQINAYLSLYASIFVYFTLIYARQIIFKDPKGTFNAFKYFFCRNSNKLTNRIQSKQKKDAWIYICRSPIYIYVYIYINC